jgi:hypothetical protein
VSETEDEELDALRQQKRLQDQARRRACQDLAKSVNQASERLGGSASLSTHTLDVLGECKDLLGAAIAEAQDLGLTCNEIAVAAGWRREVACACVSRLLDAAPDVDVRSVMSLREAKEQLNEAIREAKNHGVSEADLVRAENCRRRFHNTIEDLKGSIRVFCRVRPVLPKEAEQGEVAAVRAVDSMTLEVDRSKGGSGRYIDNDVSQFAFDSVFNPASQQEVFQDCRDLLQSAFDGYNVTIFAYGQTGSGKTYTMSGRPEQPGLAPQLIGEIYSIVDRDSARYGHRVTASMLELYRNDLIDLLQPPSEKGGPKDSSGDPPTPRKLSIRTDREGCVHVENISEEDCANAETLTAVLARGNALRKTAATCMNSESSRSHLIVTVKVVRTNLETGAELKGKIMLVDLAGSERLKKSQVVGDMQKEAIEINKSLTALGDVIEALTQGQASVPYRNHKLTQILQDSLGRTAKTLMFVHCAPSRCNVEETMATLKYAQRAKKGISGSTPPNLTPRGGPPDGAGTSVVGSSSVTSAAQIVANTQPPPAPFRKAFAACPPVGCSLGSPPG